MNDVDRANDWSAALTRATTTLAQWRRDHPWATFDEIEEARDRHLQPVLARLTAELAEGSPAAGTGTRCPGCQGLLASGGKRRRELLSEGAYRIPIERVYARCPACGWAGFPPR